MAKFILVRSGLEGTSLQLPNGLFVFPGEAGEEEDPLVWDDSTLHTPWLLVLV